MAASIGTALLSVLLFNEVKDRLTPVVAQLQAQAPPGTPAPSATSIRDVPEPVRHLLTQPLAEAYSSTFVWAVAFLALAFIPALFLPKGRKPAETVVASSNEPPPVKDEEPEPVTEGDRH